jgi:hypothetical protein
MGHIRLDSESIITGFEAAQSQFDFFPLYAILPRGCQKRSKLEMICYWNIPGGNYGDISNQSFDRSVILNLLYLIKKTAH